MELSGLPDIERRKIWQQEFNQSNQQNEVEMSPDEVEARLTLINIQEEFLEARDEKIPQMKILEDVAIDELGSAVMIGKVMMLRAESSKTEITSKLELTETTSCVLSEMALAVSLEKPVLLNGKNGLGKTALVEYMADRLGYHGIIISQLIT